MKNYRVEPNFVKCLLNRATCFLKMRAYKPGMKDLWAIQGIITPELISN